MKTYQTRTAGFIFAIIVAIVTALASSNSRAAQQDAFSVKVVGHGQPMILIPGLASDGSVWQSTVEHYAPNFECHVLTLAGFAGKPPVSGDLLDQAEDQIAHYIEVHHLNRVVIVGHSLGGFLGMRLAIHHPDLVGRLIIVDSLPALGATAVPNATPDQIHMIASQQRSSLLAADPAQRASRAQLVAQSMVTNPSDAERIKSWTLASDNQTVADAMYDVMATDLRPSLPLIKAPTLVLGTWVAFKDYAPRAVIEATYRQQYQGLAQVKFVMADNARHFIMYDDPTWMFSQIDAFLQ